MRRRSLESALLHCPALDTTQPGAGAGRGGDARRWERLSPTDRIMWVTGQLWSCSDTLGARGFDDEGLDWANSYASAARELRGTLSDCVLALDTV